MKTQYYIYRSHFFEPIQAKLVTDNENKKTIHEQLGISKSILQDEPYGVDLKLKFDVNPKWKHPDDYVSDVGFRLYSKKLVDIMGDFGVKFESYPATLIDRKGTKVDGLDYYIFHLLEGVYDAMDEVISGWTGDFHDGVEKLVLDYTKFEHRPMFILDKLYIPLIRSDLKEAINKKGIRGMDFLLPEKYKSGEKGIVFIYDD